MKSSTKVVESRDEARLTDSQFVVNSVRRCGGFYIYLPLISPTRLTSSSFSRFDINFVGDVDSIQFEPAVLSMSVNFERKKRRSKFGLVCVVCKSWERVCWLP